MIKLGSKVKHKYSNVEGIAATLQVEIGEPGRPYYQYGVIPKGTNGKGKPAVPFWTSPEALEAAKEDYIPDMPFPIEGLGTRATEENSGIEGTVVAITRHMTGCLHVTLQPEGTNPETGGLFVPLDFEINRVVGPAFPKKTEAELLLARAKTGVSPCMPSKWAEED